MTLFKTKLFVFLILGIFFQSCKDDNTVTIAGRVAYIGLEGGFYGIFGDDGIGYDPINLSADFQRDSLRVLFEGKILTEQASTHMWGKLIELKQIEKLKQK